jgi:hypothetical protein
MMMKNILQIVVLSVVFAAMSSYGAPTLGFTESWSSGTQDWNSSDPGYIDNGGNSLRLTLPDSPAYSSTIWADSGSSGEKFTGSFSGISGLVDVNNLAVEFKIKTENDYNSSPGNLGMYFVSGSHTYYYKPVVSLNQPAPGAFKTINLFIGNVSYWNNYDGGTFTTDFGAVDQFGFSFVGGPTEGMTHPIYLTDLQLLEETPVPEPETVWMILMVLASLGITFRSRLMELAGQVKARIRA